MNQYLFHSYPIEIPGSLFTQVSETWTYLPGLPVEKRPRGTTQGND